MNWPVNLFGLGTVVLHAVFAPHGIYPDCPVILYVNGALQDASTDPGPSVGDTLYLEESDELTIGNCIDGDTLVLGGIYYVALYGKTLDSAEITANPAALVAGNDSPP